MRKRARDADRRWGKGIDDEEVAMSVWREPGADARCLCDDGNVRTWAELTHGLDEVCDIEHLADAAHGYAPGLGDRPPRHALVAELHYDLRLYLPCHVISPSVNRLHGKPILRAEEGRYGNGRTGDTKGAKRLDGKRYGKYETGATQSAQYSFEPYGSQKKSCHYWARTEELKGNCGEVTVAATPH